jgi:hypothetical protein
MAFGVALVASDSLLAIELHSGRKRPYTCAAVITTKKPTRFFVDPKVDLRPKVALVPFFGLRHLGIVLPGFVLGKIDLSDLVSIDNRLLLPHRAPPLEAGFDGLKDQLSQLTVFQ